MSSTPFDVAVFDFDGTLVQSAAAKRQAFFDIFPGTCAPAVAAVLACDPDGSRHVVIPEMIAEAKRQGLAAGELDAAELLQAYGEATNRAVAAAPAMPGAEAVLRKASALAAIYVASTTPDEILKAYLGLRGWLPLVSGSYGHPHRKSDVVALLLRRHAIAPARLLVVGDGSSDREAAAVNGCRFHHIEGPHALAAIPGLEVENV